MSVLLDDFGLPHAGCHESLDLLEPDHSSFELDFQLSLVDEPEPDEAESDQLSFVDEPDQASLEAEPLHVLSLDEDPDQTKKWGNKLHIQKSFQLIYM